MGSEGVMRDSETDWKSIALALAQRLNFVLSAVESKGSPVMMNVETGAIRHWHDYIADGIKMIPGAKFDEEAFMALRLPPAKRKKRMKEIMAARKLKEPEQ